MAIILAGGPESFIEGYAHQLFADYRLHLVFYDPSLDEYDLCACADKLTLFRYTPTSKAVSAVPWIV